MKAQVGSYLSERRRAPRFRIDLRVELDGTVGITREVSLSGVFFETERSFAPGEQVNLVLVLERASPGHPVRLQCEGRVVRVTRLDKKFGVAVAISEFRFGKSARSIGLT